jgi:crossover junction endodeoxyribonuclease RuvC
MIPRLQALRIAYLLFSWYSPLKLYRKACFYSIVLFYQVLRLFFNVFISIRVFVIILAVDPSVVNAGFAVIESRNGRVVLLEAGLVKMTAKQALPERIAWLHDSFDARVSQWKVTDLALETPFLGKNAQNFLKLGYVRGILYLIAHRWRVSLHEYSPREVKHALTGFGGADKEQLARVIMQLFPGFTFPERFDITDAIALALCCLWKRR